MLRGSGKVAPIVKERNTSFFCRTILYCCFGFNLLRDKYKLVVINYDVLDELVLSLCSRMLALRFSALDCKMSQLVVVD